MILVIRLSSKQLVKAFTMNNSNFSAKKKYNDLIGRKVRRWRTPDQIKKIESYELTEAKRVGDTEIYLTGKQILKADQAINRYRDEKLRKVGKLGRMSIHRFWSHIRDAIKDSNLISVRKWEFKVFPGSLEFVMNQSEVEEMMLICDSLIKEGIIIDETMLQLKDKITKLHQHYARMKLLGN